MVIRRHDEAPQRLPQVEGEAQPEVQAGVEPGGGALQGVPPRHRLNDATAMAASFRNRLLRQGRLALAVPVLDVKVR
jgi:hypothetical protein